MTTIAYRDGIVATDTLSVSDGIVVDHAYEKCIVRDGVMFFMTGGTSDHDKLVEEYLSPTGRDTGNAAAIVADNGKILIIGGEEGGKGIFKCPNKRENYISIGSGERFAISAMDHGKSAKEAVEYAMKRDIYTGGEVKVYQV